MVQLYERKFCVSCHFSVIVLSRFN